MDTVTDADFVATLVIIVLMFALGLVQASKLHINLLWSATFSVITFVLCYVKYVVELDQPADPTFYYTSSLLGTEFRFGTDFVTSFTSIFSSGIGLGFLPITLLFTFFSLMATQLFYAAFLRTGGENTPISWHLVFLALALPSVAYWGSGITKEGFALLSVAFFCWALTKSERRMRYLVVAVVLIALVRPHMGLLMLLALTGGFLFSRDARPAERLVVGILGSLLAVTVVPLVILYAGFTDVPLTDLAGQLNERTYIFAETGAYVNIGDLPWPLKLFTYLFRPLPWEAGSFIQFAAAVQNVLLILVLVRMIPAVFSRDLWRPVVRQVSFLVFGLAGLLLLGLSTANLGISARQKWMIVFPIFFALQQPWVLRRSSIGPRGPRDQAAPGLPPQTLGSQAGA